MLAAGDVHLQIAEGEGVDRVDLDAGGIGPEVHLGGAPHAEFTKCQRLRVARVDQVLGGPGSVKVTQEAEVEAGLGDLGLLERRMVLLALLLHRQLAPLRTVKERHRRQTVGDPEPFQEVASPLGLVVGDPEDPVAGDLHRSELVAGENPHVVRPGLGGVQRGGVPVVVVARRDQHRKGQLAQLLRQKLGRVLAGMEILVEVAPDGEGVHFEFGGELDHVLEGPPQGRPATLGRPLAQASKDGVEVHIGAVEESHQVQYAPLGAPRSRQPNGQGT